MIFKASTPLILTQATGPLPAGVAMAHIVVLSIIPKVLSRQK